MPELIKRNELEFHAAVKKAMGCMDIRDMKTKHSKSIESYLVGIVSFLCPLDMANLLYLPFSLCRTLLFDQRFRPRLIPTMLCHTSITTMKINYSYMWRLIDHVE